MNKILVLSAFLFFVVSVVVKAQTHQDSTDPQIRKSLCEIKNRNFIGAQKILGEIIQTEPENIFARRLLPGVLAQQIVKDDTSPENILRIRKTVDEYAESLKILKLPGKEKQFLNNFVITLYKKISIEEATNELLVRVADKNLSSNERSQFFALLATQSQECATVILLKKPKLSKAEIEKARTCAVKGLEYANQAIELDAESELGWFQKAYLLDSASKIASLEKNPALRNSYRKQYEAAAKHVKEIYSRKQDEPDEPAVDTNQNEYNETFSQELIEYKAQKPLNKLVSDVYVPLDQALVAPVGSESEPKDIEQSDDNQIYQWKVFSPKNEEIMVELPVNVTSEIIGGSIFYNAVSDGIRFLIQAVPMESSVKDLGSDDSVLNTLAWTFVGTMKRFAVNMGDDNLEVKLESKEPLKSHPARIYGYSVGSCSRITVGTLIAVKGKNTSFIIDIRGAGKENANVQRVLTSLKLK